MLSVGETSAHRNIKHQIQRKAPMKNAKLLAISNEAAANLQALVRENEDKLLEAWSSCEDEAQANETKPKFKLGLSITLDLDADKMTTDLSWGVRYKA